MKTYILIPYEQIVMATYWHHALYYTNVKQRCCNILGPIKYVQTNYIMWKTGRTGRIINELIARKWWVQSGLFMVSEAG